MFATTTHLDSKMVANFLVSRYFRINDLVYSPTVIDAVCTFVIQDSRIIRLSYWEESRIGVVEVAPYSSGAPDVMEAYSYHHTSVPDPFKPFVSLLKLNFDNRATLSHISKVLGTQETNVKVAV